MTETLIEIEEGEGRRQPDGTWGGCASIAWLIGSGSCLFYDRIVEETQIFVYTTTPFVSNRFIMICLAVFLEQWSPRRAVWYQVGMGEWL